MSSKPRKKISDMFGRNLEVALRLPAVGRIVNDIATHMDEPGDTTRRNVLTRAGNNQTSAGSGLQKIQGLISDHVVVSVPTYESSSRGMYPAPETLHITEEGAKRIIAIYTQDISERQLVIDALLQRYPHLGQ